MEKIEETLVLINQRLDALEALVNGKAKAKKASPKNKTPAVSKTIPEFLDYIEDILVDLKACLDSDKYPKSGQDCDNCRWYNEKRKLSYEIKSKKS